MTSLFWLLVTHKVIAKTILHVNCPVYVFCICYTSLQTVLGMQVCLFVAVDNVKHGVT